MIISLIVYGKFSACKQLCFIFAITLDYRKRTGIRIILYGNSIAALLGNFKGDQSVIQYIVFGGDDLFEIIATQRQFNLIGFAVFQYTEAVLLAKAYLIFIQYLKYRTVDGRSVMSAHLFDRKLTRNGLVDPIGSSILGNSNIFRHSYIADVHIADFIAHLIPAGSKNFAELIDAVGKVCEGNLAVCIRYGVVGTVELSIITAVYQLQSEHCAGKHLSAFRLFHKLNPPKQKIVYYALRNGSIMSFGCYIQLDSLYRLKSVGSFCFVQIICTHYDVFNGKYTVGIGDELGGFGLLAQSGKCIRAIGTGSFHIASGGTHFKAYAAEQLSILVRLGKLQVRSYKGIAYSYGFIGVGYCKSLFSLADYIAFGCACFNELIAACWQIIHLE